MAVCQPTSSRQPSTFDVPLASDLDRLTNLSLQRLPDEGLTIQDVPFDSDSTLLTYTDASWANSAHSTSQHGVVVTLTVKNVTEAIEPVSILDWRPFRSPRFARSTLAAEAMAADEGADRSAFLNMMISQIIYNEPAHRLGSKMRYLQATDAKSLYDSVISEGRISAHFSMCEPSRRP